jgi:hypothetical protein
MGSIPLLFLKGDDMSCYLVLPLHRKPCESQAVGWEVTPDQLRALGRDRAARLEEAVGIVEKLASAGWDSRLGLTVVCIEPPAPLTAPAVEQQLRELGIDRDRVVIVEQYQKSLKRFITSWGRKFPEGGEQTIGEIAQSLEEAAQQLRAMEEGGVTLAGAADEGDANLVTDDPEVANAWDFEKGDFDDEDDDEGPF